MHNIRVLEKIPGADQFSMTEIEITSSFASADEAKKALPLIIDEVKSQKKRLTGTTAGTQTTNQGAKATAKQINFLLQKARSANTDARNLAQQRFGKRELSDLTSQEASVLIEELLNAAPSK